MTVHRTHPKTSRSGFTLVELLVVIAIVGLLASIAVPSLQAIRYQAMETASQTLIHLIAGGVDQYEAEFEEYPPVAIADLNAAQTLCFMMIGYADDKGTAGQAADSGAFYEDDGCDGYGWRLPSRHRGKQHGPYNGLENAPIRRGDPGEWVFIDRFDRIIWYARYDGDVELGDNPPVSAGYFKDGGGKPYRKDYFLYSSGRDGEFKSFSEKPTSDDITNFGN